MAWNPFSWGREPNKSSDGETNSEESPLLPTGTENEQIQDVGADDPSAWPGAKDFEGLTWWHKPSVFWLLPGFSIYSIAFGGIIIPRLDLILTLVCRDYLSELAFEHPELTFTPVDIFGSNPQCRTPEVQKLATKFTLYTSLITGILCALSSPKLGTLSDRYGRRLLLSVTTCGGLISELVYILAAAYPDLIHYNWLLLGAFFDGVCGSFIAGMAITHSYAADCTAPPKRAVAFGYLHACLFGGIAVGPFIGGAITKATGGDVLPVFYGALGCHLLFLGFLLFIIPESLPKKRQIAARERHKVEVQESESGSVLDILKFANVLDPLKILYPTGDGSSSQVRMNLLLLSAVDAIIFGVAMGAMTVIIFYSKFRFGWEGYESQIFIGSANICRVTGLIVFLPLLNYIFRTRRQNRVRRESGIELVERNTGSDNLDLYTIRVSLIFEAIGFALYSVAKIGPVFFLGGLVASFGGMGGPVLQSALTKHVPHDRVGQVLGATGLLHALGRVVCPVVFSAIYYGTVDTVPETVFIVLTGCFVVAVILSFLIRPHIYLEDKGHYHTTSREEEAREERAAERIEDEEIAGL